MVPKSIAKSKGAREWQHGDGNLVASCAVYGVMIHIREVEL